MMRKLSKVPESVVGMFLGLVAVLFLYKESLVMPMGLEGILEVVLLISFLVYVGVVWNEAADDEREGMHILMAGRNSFLVGVAILVVGVVKQSFLGNIDPWLVFALIGMLVSKVVSRAYSHKNH